MISMDASSSRYSESLPVPVLAFPILVTLYLPIDLNNSPMPTPILYMYQYWCLNYHQHQSHQVCMYGVSLRAAIYRNTRRAHSHCIPLKRPAPASRGWSRLVGAERAPLWASRMPLAATAQQRTRTQLDWTGLAQACSCSAHSDWALQRGLCAFGPVLGVK